jgi:hypothetical protein
LTINTEFLHVEYPIDHEGHVKSDHHEQVEHKQPNDQREFLRMTAVTAKRTVTAHFLAACIAVA